MKREILTFGFILFALILFVSFKIKDFEIVDEGLNRFVNETFNNTQEENKVISLSDSVKEKSYSIFNLEEIELEELNINLLDLNVDLQLVNYENAISENFNSNIVSAYGEVPVLYSEIDLEKKLLNSVRELFYEAKLIGYNNFIVNSGYRTFDKQENLYETATDKSFVSKPNYSEHQTGLAIDIGYKGLSGAEMGKAKEGIWLSQNAHKFGLILRYPENKTEITKISYEPWHFRYIGIPHAYICFENNLCLEEYIDLLKTNSGIKYVANGKVYYIYHQSILGDIIKVPSRLGYKISSDNMDGVIVTVIKGD